MRCPECGFKNKDDEVLCTVCGWNLKEAVKPEASSPPPEGEREGGSAEEAPGPEMLNCPSCGRPMERGFLLAPNEGYFRGIRWSEKESFVWPYAGEPLLRGGFFASNTNVPAFRCTSCGIVTLRY